GHGNIAVLERSGRIQGVIFDVEMVEAHCLAEILRLNKGREAGAQVDRITRRRRQQLAIAPDAGRSAGDGVTGDPLPDRIEVVGDLERSETVLADIGGLEVTQSPALSTSQPLHRFLLDAYCPHPALPRERGREPSAALPQRGREQNKKPLSNRGLKVRDHVIFQTLVWRTFHLAGVSGRLAGFFGPGPSATLDNRRYSVVGKD